MTLTFDPNAPVYWDPKPGESIVVSQQGGLPGFVLAISEDKRYCLVEYETPEGCTCLGEIKLGYGVYEVGRYELANQLSYNELSNQWLIEVILAGQEWIGRPKGKRNYGLPAAILGHRLGLDAAILTKNLFSLHDGIGKGISRKIQKALGFETCGPCGRVNRKGAECQCQGTQDW